MRIWGMEHESSIELSPEDRARLEGWVLHRVRPENSRKGRKGAKSVRVTALGAFPTRMGYLDLGA